MEASSDKSTQVTLHLAVNVWVDLLDYSILESQEK